MLRYEVALWNLFSCLFFPHSPFIPGSCFLETFYLCNNREAYRALIFFLCLSLKPPFWFYIWTSLIQCFYVFSDKHLLRKLMLENSSAIIGERLSWWGKVPSEFIYPLVFSLTLLNKSKFNNGTWAIERCHKLLIQKIGLTQHWTSVLVHH